MYLFCISVLWLILLVRVLYFCTVADPASTCFVFLYCGWAFLYLFAGSLLLLVLPVFVFLHCCWACLYLFGISVLLLSLSVLFLGLSVLVCLFACLFVCLFVFIGIVAGPVCTCLFVCLLVCLFCLFLVFIVAGPACTCLSVLVGSAFCLYIDSIP